MPFVVVAGIPAFLPVRMTKTGTQPMPEAWGLIKNWTADTGGFPGSVVVNDGLRAVGNKNAAAVTASIPFTGATTGFGGPTQLQARLRVNSTIVATIDPPVEGPSGTLTVNATVDIAAGDLVTVEALAVPASGGAAGTVSAGGYVRIL
ncbi:hypothetical protein [Nocardia sp. XZ_19_369]|uniref:hypothetical protein n=1 Tax=Nocardia sp. XZ_19_369 TaxID=2769487 RepID=UPI00188E8AC3|nr:hypothetical protein [Nocardia sp. XZ_19_369]